MGIPTIEINLDKKCSTCGEDGATENGLCMKCVTEKAFPRQRKTDQMGIDLYYKIECEGDPLEVFHLDYDLIEGDTKWRDDDGRLRSMYERLLHEFGDGVFHHLIAYDADIHFMWKAKGGKKGGKETLGYCKKPSGELKHFSEKDFLIVLSADHCNSRQMKNWEILALLYHELRHTDYDIEAGTFTTNAHDFEGFNDELELFGAWTNSRENIIKTAQSLPLFD